MYANTINIKHQLHSILMAIKNSFLKHVSLIFKRDTWYLLECREVASEALEFWVLLHEIFV